MSALKRAIRFVSALSKKPTQSISNGKVVLFHNNVRISMPIKHVEELVSQGVLNWQAGNLETRDEARAWLKRQKHVVAGKEDVISGNVIMQSENDTITRLSKMSRGCSFLQAHHVLVANRLCKLIEKSQLRTNITQDLSIVRVDGNTPSPDISDMSIDARTKVNALLSHLPKECGGVVLDVCGFNKGLQQIEF